MNIGKFGVFLLTIGEDIFTICVAYFDPGKLQILMDLLNQRLSPEQHDRSNTDTHYAYNVSGCSVFN